MCSLFCFQCRDEFENRTQLCQKYEKAELALTAGSLAEAELLEAKATAKRKMLGNIKFIGELGKLQIMHDSILHRCCEQLLVGRRRQPIEDQAEDLECLVHLMRTCGRLLDTPKAKVRMDQYFERLLQHTQNEEMPLRIRFMIQDILEMRRNKWNPRKLGKAPEGPRTIQQVREDAYRDGCIYMPQQSPPGTAQSVLKQAANAGLSGMGSLLNPLEGSFFDKKPLDLFGAGAGTGTGYGSAANAGGYLGAGPGTISYEDDEEDDLIEPPRPAPAPAPAPVAKQQPPPVQQQQQQSPKQQQNNYSQQQQQQPDPTAARPDIKPQQQSKQQPQHHQSPMHNQRESNNRDHHYNQQQREHHPREQQQPYHRQQQPQQQQYERHQNHDQHHSRDREDNRNHRQQREQQPARDSRPDRSQSPVGAPTDRAENNGYHDRRGDYRDRDHYNNSRHHYNNDDDHYEGGYGRGGHFDRGGRGGFRGRGSFNHFNNRGGGGFHNRDRDDDYNRGGGYYNRGEKPTDFGDRYSSNRGPRGGRGRFDDGGSYGGRGGFRGGYRGGHMQHGGGGDHHDSEDPMHQSSGGQQGGAMPPRFKKMGMESPDGREQQYRQGGPGGGGGGYHRDSPPPPNPSGGPPPPLNPGGAPPEVSLRPQAAASMCFKPKTPSMLPKSAIRGTDGSSPLGENSLLGPPLPTAPAKVMMQQQEPLMIKQGSLDKGKKAGGRGGASGKGPTRDEVFAKTGSLLSDLLEHRSTNEACEMWKEGDWLPSKMNQTAVTHLVKAVLVKESAEDLELCLQFLGQLVADEGNSIHATHCLEASNKIVGSNIPEMEKQCKGERSYSIIKDGSSYLDCQFCLLQEILVF